MEFVPESVIKPKSLPNDAFKHSFHKLLYYLTTRAISYISVAYMVNFALVWPIYQSNLNCPVRKLAYGPHNHVVSFFLF